MKENTKDDVIRWKNLTKERLTVTFITFIAHRTLVIFILAVGLQMAAQSGVVQKSSAAELAHQWL